MGLKIDRTQTGIASEFYVAGELSRLGYVVTVTFGNTKAIDLLIQKDDKVYPVQVKGIQSTKSICWNLDKTKVKENIYFVLVNLHIDKPDTKPEFFVLTGDEARRLFIDTNAAGEKRTYLDYNKIKKLGIYENRWTIFGKATIEEDDETEWKNLSVSSFINRYNSDEPGYSASDIKEPNPDYK